MVRHLPGTDEIEDHASRHALVRWCAAIADSAAFNSAIIVVIVANAVVLGLETFDGIAERHGGWLNALDRTFLSIFIAELAIRFVAVGARPRRFLRHGWNAFDVLVICAVFLPGLRENATLLRLVRVGRATRVVRLLPDLRVLTVAIIRALPAAASLSAMGLLVVFVYGMVGWTAFGDDYPHEYGNVVRAMLTLFVTLTLENFPDQLELGRSVSPWATLYFISYALVASFLLFNILLGIVINAMEEARALEAARLAVNEREAALKPDRRRNGADGVGVPDVEQQIARMRAALDELEASLSARR